MSFLPALAQRLLGEDLQLAQYRDLVVRPTTANASTVVAGLERLRDQRARSATGARASATVARRVDAHGAADGGDERARADRRAINGARRRFRRPGTSSSPTTPAWDDGRLDAAAFRAARLRRGDAGRLAVMPGGFCRVSEPGRRARRVDGRRRAIGRRLGAQRAGRSKRSTLLPPPKIAPHRARARQSAEPRRRQSVLDRTLSRARRSDAARRALPVQRGSAETPTRRCDACSGRQSIERLARLLIAWGAAPEDEAGHATATQIALARRSPTPTLTARRVATSCARKRAASIIRERLSQDVWQLIGRLETRLDARRRGARSRRAGDARIASSDALHTLAALSGLIDENFNRVAGWSFLDLGRRIERAINTCRFARQFAGDDATVETLDVLLDLINSQITYRSRYIAGVALAPVLDMAMLDPFNPRSVAFQVDAHRRTSRGAAGACATTACWRSRGDSPCSCAPNSTSEDARRLDAATHSRDRAAADDSRRRDRRALLPARRRRRAQTRQPSRLA